MGKIRRSLSMLLSIAMIMTSLYVPAPVYAAEDEAVIATGGSEENVDITSQGEENSPEEDRELPGVEEKDEIIDDSEFEGQIESENIDLSSSEEDAYVIEDRPMPEVVEEPVEDEPEILGLSYEADDAIEQIIEDRAVFEADDDLSSIVSAVKPSGKVSNPIYLDYEYVENEDLNLYGIAHYSDPSDASVARYSADGYKFGDNSTKRVLDVKGNKDVAFFEFTVNDISKISVWAKSANTTDTLQIYEVAKSDMETAGYHKVTLAGGDTEYRAIGDAFTAADYVTGVQIDSDGSKAPYVLTVPATNDEPVTYALASKDGGWFVNGIDVLATGAEEYAVNSSKRNIAHSFTVENDDNTYTYTVDQEDHYYYVGTDDSEPAYPKAKRGDLITLKVLDETKAGVPSVTYKDGDDDVTLTIDDGITVVKPGKEFTFVMPAFDVTIAMEAGSVYYKLGVVDSDEFWQSVTSVKLTDTESSLTKTINTVAKESQLNKILEGIKVQINPKDNPGYATYVSITSPTAFKISYYDAAGTAKVYDPENTVPVDTSTDFAERIDASKPVEFDMPADDVAVDVRLKDYAYHVYAADELSKADFKYTVNSTAGDQKKTPVLEATENNVDIKSLDTVRIYPVDVAGDHRVGAIEYQPKSADPATGEWTRLTKDDATGVFWTIDMPAEDLRIRSVRAYYVKRGDTFGTDLSVTVSAEKGIEPDIVETLSTVDVTADDGGEAYVYPGDVITVTTTINRSLVAYKRIDSMENGNGEDGLKLFKPESILVKDKVKDGVTVPVQESVFSAAVPDNNKPVVLNIGTAATKDVTFDFGDGIKEINLTGYPKTDSSKAVAIDESVSKISKPATGTTATVKGVYDVNDSVGFTVSTEPVAAWKVYGAPSVTVDGNDSLVGPDTEKNNEYRFMTDAAQTVKVSATPYWNLATQLKYGTDDVQAYSAGANVVKEVAVTVAEGSDPIVNPTVEATATAAKKSTLFLTDYDSVENINAENDTNRNKINLNYSRGLKI